MLGWYSLHTQTIIPAEGSTLRNIQPYFQQSFSAKQRRTKPIINGFPVIKTPNVGFCILQQSPSCRTTYPVNHMRDMLGDTVAPEQLPHREFINPSTRF